MATPVLSPFPIFHQDTSAGAPASGYKLFTYAAGTTTKQTTYTDETGGTQNTNPVILDSNGNANVWLDPTLIYKFEFALPGDTDPPTSPIWTEDNISPSLSVAALSAVGSAALIGANDGASGTIFTTVQGFISKILSSAGASIVGFIQAGAGAVMRSLQSKERDIVSVKDFGAKGDGATDDTAAFTTAASNGAFLVPPGTYEITSSITINSFVTFEAGAILNTSTGVTVAFTGGLSAPPAQIFSNATPGLGTVTINSAITPVGYPEWWGAQANSLSLDNSPFIQACINACATTFLAAGQYSIGTGAAGVGANLLTIGVSGKSLRGCGASQTSSLNCTELLVQSASASGLLIGHATNPGGSGTSNWVEGVVVDGLSIRRNVATYPLGNPASGTTNAPCGIKMQWAKVCTITEQVYLFEHSFGVYITATVACKDGSRVERYTSGINAGNDFAVGKYQDNSPSTPFNSGNASLYYTGGGFFSNMAAGNSYTYAAGIQSYNGFTDTYVTGFETANGGYGCDMNGRQTTTADFQTEDLIITQCVFDGCRWDGVRIQTGGPTTAVQITNNYIGVSNATGPVSNAVHIENVHGSVGISNNQYIGSAGNPANGLFIDTSSGVISRGNVYTDISNPVVVSSGVVFRIEDHINVSEVNPATAAVQVTGATRGVIDCDIQASASGTAVPIGVDLIGSGNSLIEVRCTNINSANITGGSANKLVSNGTQITTVGSFGTNCLASGIML